MKTINKLFEDAIEHWRINKGVGTALIPFPLEDRFMILGILQNIYSRSPTCTTTIVVKDFSERLKIIEFLTNQKDENDEEFHNLIEHKFIRVYTESFIENQHIFSVPLLCIWYHPTELKEYVYNQFNKSQFRLIVLNKRLQNNDEMVELYKHCNLLSDFKQADIDQLRVTSPVEETLIGVSIKEDSEQDKLLKYYNKYIEVSLNIFGNFESMDKARNGDFGTNTSAVDICYQIAINNGWSNTLDMSFEYNRQLDELYNPNHLADRAKETYEIIRNRSQLLSDYDAKLEEICEIISNNPDKKILIINKRADFANVVTAYLNNISENIICGNYHDKCENIPAVDINGNPVYYKSGTKKGQRRELASQAQKTLNETLFNLDKIRILSTNNSPDKNLSVNVDIVIITSSQCENIENYLYRLSNIRVSSPLKVYTIYVKNSQEERLVQEKTESETHKIVKKYENQIVSENNSDFVIVD